MFSCMPFGKQVECLDKRQCNLHQIPEDILRYGRTLEELLLDSNHIKELSKHLFRLQKLRRLTLNDNEIVRLPADISQLANLAELELNNNDVSEIPENIKFCKNLQYFDVSSNPIQRLPACITELRALTYLNLSDISLADLPPDIGKLSNLTVLELRNNAISRLPPSITFLTRLERLDLGQNDLEHLPTDIGKLNNLQELYVDNNSLEELPKEIADLQMLQSLDLTENKQLSSIPDEIGELKNLNELTLSLNSLEVLPHSIGRLKKLTILKLERNRLITLTPAVGSCVSLQELILTENRLNELPSSIGNLRDLTNLNVDRNLLLELPSTIGGCLNLGILSLRDNLVTTLPDELGKLEKLRMLDVSGNRLQYLPFTLNNLSDLYALWLSENQSQPMLKLQTDTDQRTGVKVLTCYLLPQQDYHAEDGQRNAPVAGNGVVPGVPGFVGGPKVHFPDVDQESLEEDENTGKFERHDTPHPKHGAKPKGRQIDGHVIHHEGPKKSDKGHTIFRVGETRRRNSGGSEDGAPTHDAGFSDAKHRSSPVRVAPAPPPASRPSIHSQDSYQYHDDEPESPPRTKSMDVDEMEHAQHDSDGYHDAGKSVNFTTDDKQEDAEEHRNRLQRKNTPHPLKTSALTMDSTVAQEKVSEILAKQQLQQQQQHQQSKISTTSDPGRAYQQTSASNSILTNGYDLYMQYEEQTVIIRRTDQGLGLSIAGGVGSTPYKEKSSAIYISKIVENGAADRAGLKIDDKLIAVNGVGVGNVDHERCAELMRMSDPLELTIVREILKPSARAYGETPTAPVAKRSFDESPGLEKRVGIGGGSPKDLKIRETISTTIKRESDGLGFSVAGGKGSPSWKDLDDSIYISKITPGGPVDRGGRLKVGDKVLLINGVNIESARQDQAVALLTGCNGEVHLVVQREKLASVPSQSSIGPTVAPLKIQTPTVPVPKVADEEDISPLAQSSPLLTSHKPAATSQNNFFAEDTTEEVKLLKRGGPLGLSIVGGSDHSSHPFGVDNPGVFVSKVVPDGAAAKTGKLRIGDRILSVNGKDITKATHQEAVSSLITNANEIWMKVRHERQPAGLKELTVTRIGDEPLGISISGGVSTPANPTDPSDEGIFISRVTPGGAASRDGRLKIGMRILEVNNKSMLGAYQSDAADALRSAGPHVQLLVCDGFDAKLIPPSPDLSGSKDESFPSLKDDVFTSLTPLATLPSYPPPPIPAPRSVPLKMEAPMIVDRKTPLTPPVRTADNVVVVSESQTRTTVAETKTSSMTTKMEKNEFVLRATTASNLTESKIPTKISPPKDLNLTSKANPSPSTPTDDLSSPLSSTSSPTKKPIGIPVPRPYVSKPISTPKPIISPTSPQRTQETSKIPTRTNENMTVNGSKSAPKPPTKTATLAKPEDIVPLDTSEIEPSASHNDSSFVDPIMQSRIPSAKVSASYQGAKTPESPVTPSGESHPEKLPFSRKIERFQHEIEQQSEEAHKSKIAPPKKVPLVHRNDVERLREEETKKIAAVGGQRRLVENYADAENYEHYGEEGYEQILQSSSTGPSVVRTKKAENRMKTTGPTTTVATDESRLSAAELRAREAEKRAEWRKARLKSLERDALKADQVMAKFREMTGSDESLDKEMLASDDEEDRYYSCNQNGEKKTNQSRQKLQKRDVSSDASENAADDDDSDVDVSCRNGADSNGKYLGFYQPLTTTTATEKIVSVTTRHHTDEIGFIDDSNSLKGSLDKGLDVGDSAAKRS